MPQARRSGSSKSGSGSGSRGSRASGSGSGSRGSRATSSRSTRSKSGSSSRSSASGRSTSAKRSTSSAARSSRSRTRTSSGPDARFEAAAQRLRRLNERIIDAGRDAGEATLTSYEKALKTIADAIEKGPGSSQLDWVSSLFTAQAKMIRDLAGSSTSAARKVLS